MAVQADRIVFRIDAQNLREAFEAFRDPENQRYLKGWLNEERVETIIRLTQLFLDEVISNREWSLEVWGWLRCLIRHIGDEHALSIAFSDHGILRLNILNRDNYQVLFNEVVVGRAVPVEGPHLDRIPSGTPTGVLDTEDDEGLDDPVPGEHGGVPDSLPGKFVGSALGDDVDDDDLEGRGC